ncbi:curli assembly protein CsgF [Agrobacterium tumefaciens]|uniref:curli assembly protein CsgF n=1 Tax=Agrobacterium tumefaciens TaxID=358 RepID=UPI00287D2AF6|nr:curli assembly protein CsgF [Agrobacterium tumefaciens]MDS7594910.1 curli assembly protein CsgF [Agrobacterium tumefaciens]
MKNMRYTLLAAAVLLAGSAQASQLVYRPVNPSLGGDPLNGSWLLSQATSQGDGASQSPGFTIDFPDFGGVTQPVPDPSTLPDVDGSTSGN